MTALIIGQCKECLVLSGHDLDCSQYTSAAPLPPAFTVLPEAGAGYRRVVIIEPTALWLSQYMCMRKLDLLKEKKQLLRARGPGTTYSVELQAIEEELHHINHLQDALA